MKEELIQICLILARQEFVVTLDIVTRDSKKFGNGATSHKDNICEKILQFGWYDVLEALHLRIKLLPSYLQLQVHLFKGISRSWLYDSCREEGSCSWECEAWSSGGMAQPPQSRCHGRRPSPQSLGRSGPRMTLYLGLGEEQDAQNFLKRKLVGF